jgi:hypothetical protein
MRVDPVTAPSATASLPKPPLARGGSSGTTTAAASALSGAALAAALCPGHRVIRGSNWQWHDQDGGEGRVGTVAETERSHPDKHKGWVAVRWDASQRTNSYRMGEGNAFDLALAPGFIIDPANATSAAATRTSVLTVGQRVVRGPDWKWSSQVRS